MRVNVSIADDVLKIADENAKQIGLARSSYFSYLVMKEHGARSYSYAYEKYCLAIDCLMGDGEDWERIEAAFINTRRPFTESNFPEKAYICHQELEGVFSTSYEIAEAKGFKLSDKEPLGGSIKYMDEETISKCKRLFLRIYTLLARSDHSTFWL